MTIYVIYSSNHGAFESEMGAIGNYDGTKAVGQECPKPIRTFLVTGHWVLL